MPWKYLIAAPELGSDRTHLAGIRDRVREGSPLAEAIAQSAGAFSPYEQAVIEVGERSGTLEIVLDRLAKILGGAAEGQGTDPNRLDLPGDCRHAGRRDLRRHAGRDDSTLERKTR